MIRRDLDVVKKLSAGVLRGLPASEVHAGINELKASGPLWRLKVSCLRYCRFVHSHHNLEDELLLPALRRRNPAINPVVDKLEEDHRVVSGLLDAVEAAADEVFENDGELARCRVADALNALAEHLLSHLDFEERNAGPTIRRMSGL
jgi:iron-sulfur cluster repair protein YtfE (RIC family)